MAVWTLTNAQGTAWSIEAEVVRPTEDDLDFKNGQGEIVAVVSRSGIVAIREDAKVQHQ